MIVSGVFVTPFCCGMLQSGRDDAKSMAEAVMAELNLAQSSILQQVSAVLTRTKAKQNDSRSVHKHASEASFHATQIQNL